MHAPLAPSALDLTVKCTASVQLQAACPPAAETDEEAEGTAGHVVAMKHAAGVEWPVDFPFQSGGRNWTVTQDMYDGARLWARTVGFHFDLRLESGVRVSRIHPEHCWGTPDAWRYFPQGTGPNETPLIKVWDYKFGHRYVEVFELFQLIAYALGVIEHLQLHDENLLVELAIVQPRCYVAEPVRTWRVRAVDLRALANIAANKGAEALGPDPQATVGAHCIDCRARHQCNTLRYATNNVVEYAQRGELKPLDAIAMGQELRVLDAVIKILEARHTGLAAQVEAYLRAGQSVPFYQLQPGQSRLQWNDDVKPEDMALAAELMGVQIRKPMAIKTPRQVIDAGIDEAVILQYAHRQTPALDLKQTSTIQARKALGVTRT